jgi:hypothetical protein
LVDGCEGRDRAKDVLRIMPTIRRLLSTGTVYSMGHNNNNNIILEYSVYWRIVSRNLSNLIVKHVETKIGFLRFKLGIAGYHCARFHVDTSYIIGKDTFSKFHTEIPHGSKGFELRFHEMREEVACNVTSKSTVRRRIFSLVEVEVGERGKSETGSKITTSRHPFVITSIAR